MRIRIQWLLVAFPLLAVTAAAEDAAKPAAPALAMVEVEAGDLKLSVPKVWRQEQPSNKLRLAQFSILATGGDDESSEFVVSPPIGGTREANVARWIDQFQKEDREVVMSVGKCPQGEYLYIEISGTYRRPFGPPIARKFEDAPGYRMHGLILSATKDGKPAGNYYLKLVGPLNTVKAYQDSVRMSVGADKATEEKYELPK
jgi:gluconolactonase